MLKNFTPRLYQQTILGTAVKGNTLVVLPTGLGKTALAFLLAAQRLHQYPQSKILMLAPTKPLCEQHVATFRTHLELPEEQIVLFTGSVKPTERARLWQLATVIVSTPQGLENDIINRRVDLRDVTLLVFDEAHHATGDYAYVWVAKQYMQVRAYNRILALTASPGSDIEKIREICDNLLIEHVEVRTEKDADVQGYVQPLQKNWILVPFPEQFKKIQHLLQACRKKKLLEAQQYGYCNDVNAHKGVLLKLQGELGNLMRQGDRTPELLRSVSLVAEALKVEHALELLETQGISPLLRYLTSIQKQGATSTIKAVQRLVQDAYFKSACVLTKSLVDAGVRHPKQLKLLELLQEALSVRSEAKFIIFTQFRDSAQRIVELLKEADISHHIFVGQAKKKGLGFSQKEQKAILDRFRQGEFRCLVATSVAEEGLDIPKVDTVIFYEPVPSAIRAIQRRGRTGRLEEGNVTFLVTQGTRDEAYRWSSHHKEKRMYKNLEILKKTFAYQPQKTIDTFAPSDQAITILADHREKGNQTVKALIDLGVHVSTVQLACADYVLSGHVGVELKAIPDFVQSIIDGRLLSQVHELKGQYAKALVIIQGQEDLYAIRNIHPNAVRGALAAVAVGFGVPILWTKDAKDTAELLAAIAKREQGTGRAVQVHDQKPKSVKSQQEFVIAAMPGVGGKQAQRLLQHFGSVGSILGASTEELLAVEGVGKKTAQGIYDLLWKPYG